MQTSALGEIHKSVCRRAANIEELLNVQRILGIALVKRGRVGDRAATWTVRHPG